MTAPRKQSPYGCAILTRDGQLWFTELWEGRNILRIIGPFFDQDKALSFGVTWASAMGSGSAKALELIR